MRLRRYVLWFLSIAINFYHFSAYSQAPFNRGVNLTGWFQANTPGQIQFTRFTKQDIINIKSLGCDVIRLPVNLNSMTSGSPSYTLDPLYVSFQDSVVTWCEQLHIYLIIDNHSFDPNADTSPDIGNVLVKVWSQMADHYRDRSDFSGTKFDIRFIDTKAQISDDHPWRMSFTLDDCNSPWDRKWQHINIPLASFKETGSWDNNSWYNPEGKFDWKAIDRFEISTEYSVFPGSRLWFDNICITNQDTAIVRETGILGTEKITEQTWPVLKVAPNPIQTL